MEWMPQRIGGLAMRLRRSVVVVAAAAAFATGACAAPGGGSTAAPATPPPATAAPASAAPGTPASAPLSLEVAQDATLGSYVAGKDGLALYIFTRDSGGTSNCNDDCAASWPPLTVTMADDVTSGAGVTAELGTITRADGSLQVTLGGHPLYYFASDKAAGDVKGQGLNDVWFLAAPDGSGVGMSAGPGPSPTECSSRTCY
jgi:predicted lipoprotein with Yx(FWY)xxD motif